MKVIYKYPLAITDVQSIEMPVRSEILCVQMQLDKPCIWAKVETDEPSDVKTIRIYGTGHPIDEDGQYIGTFQLQSEGLVFHVFDNTPKQN